jgi:hypothetical protein
VLLCVPAGLLANGSRQREPLLYPVELPPLVIALQEHAIILIQTGNSGATLRWQAREEKVDESAQGLRQSIDRESTSSKRQNPALLVAKPKTSGFQII